MWASNLADRVFTMMMFECRKKYSTANFTTVSKSTTPPSFPNVYFKKLQGMPQGYTLEDAQLNGITLPIQIEVADNANQQTAEDISWHIADIMAGFGFRMTGDPAPDESDGIYKYYTRYQRVIGYNDKLNF